MEFVWVRLARAWQDEQLLIRAGKDQKGLALQAGPDMDRAGRIW